MTPVDFDSDLVITMAHITFHVNRVVSPAPSRPIHTHPQPLPRSRNPLRHLSPAHPQPLPNSSTPQIRKERHSPFGSAALVNQTHPLLRECGAMPLPDLVPPQLTHTCPAGPRTQGNSSTTPLSTAEATSASSSSRNEAGAASRAARRFSESPVRAASVPRPTPAAAIAHPTLPPVHSPIQPTGPPPNRATPATPPSPLKTRSPNRLSFEHMF